MILILILAIIFVIAAFIFLPGFLDLMVDSYDEWKQVMERIKRRANR
jgi:hypothetical protein